MAPPSKAAVLLGIPVQPQAGQRTHHVDSTKYPGQAVRTNPSLYTPAPTRNEHTVAILLHTRGVPGIGCRRDRDNLKRQFSECIVAPYDQNGDQLVAKCSNCHFAADGTPCGAIPQGGAQTSQAQSPSAPAPVPVPQSQAAPGPLPVSFTPINRRLQTLPASSVATGPSNHSRNFSNESFRASATHQSSGSPSVLRGFDRGSPQYNALHDQNWLSQLTQENVVQLSEQSQHSFSIPTEDVESATSAALSRIGVVDSRQAHLRDIESRMSALRRARAIGLEQAMEELVAERTRVLSNRQQHDQSLE
jgi:hypothetical protein